MVEMLFAIVGAGIATASISFTVTMSAIFAPLRDWVEERSKFFGDLIQCPYCFGHYIALGWNIIIFLGTDLSGGYNNIYNWILFIFVWFLIVGIMSLCHKSILTAYDPVMKIKAQKALDKLKKAKQEENNNN